MMNRKITNSDFFVTGGTLVPDAPSYVKRPADDELLNLALKGTFCYVLTPRQMGKSSLMNRTAYRLKAKKVRTAIIDLTQIGTVPINQWYLGLLSELKRQLDLSVNLFSWWQEQGSLPVVYRFTTFLRDILLTEIKEQIVIFIDEIDSTLNLDFRDDFFAVIRSLYNTRANQPEFERLTFVLLGVAISTDLIQDTARTPFNIGKAMTLEEFSLLEATVLQKGLEAVYPNQGQFLFSRIYYWTNGYPYLTQRLCLAVATSGEKHPTAQKIDCLVEKLFLSSQGVGKEMHLQFVQNIVLHHPQKQQLLNLYQKVYKGQTIADDPQSSIHNHLKLSGLVKIEKGILTPRNPIYRRVFNLDWVKRNAESSRKKLFVFFNKYLS